MFNLTRLEKRKLIISILLIAVVAIVVIAIGIPTLSSYYTEKEYTVTVTEKEVKNTSYDSTYLVFTKLENGEIRTFCIEDDWIKFRFNSSDVYAGIEVGETYNIVVVGWRIPYISYYENIMEYSKIS